MVLAPRRTRLADGLVWLVATGAGVGLAPVAPGTVASAAAVLAYALLPIGPGSAALWALVVGGSVVGVWAAGRLAARLGPDPAAAVCDELVGVWVACLFAPKTWPYLLGAFLLFRLFDILKPFPIRRLERLPGGLGIMADDLLAGAYAGAILWAAAALLP